MSATPAQTALLQARGLSLQRGNTSVLSNCNASFRAGAITAVVGPNGAGKSSLLQALAGLLPYQAGEVLYGAQALAALPAKARARTLAWLDQELLGPAELSVYDIVALARLPHQVWWAGLSKHDHQAIGAALHDCDLWALRERAFADLSGGERQRVLLARVLAGQAPVLLLDEPLAHLDAPHQTQWLRLMRGLSAAGATVIVVLHDLSVALAADDMVILAQGRVRHHGACSDATTHRALEAVFGHCISVHRLERQWVAVPKITN